GAGNGHRLAAGRVDLALGAVRRARGLPLCRRRGCHRQRHDQLSASAFRSRRRLRRGWPAARPLLGKRHGRARAGQPGAHQDPRRTPVGRRRGRGAVALPGRHPGGRAHAGRDRRMGRARHRLFQFGDVPDHLHAHARTLHRADGVHLGPLVHGHRRRRGYPGADGPGRGPSRPGACVLHSACRLCLRRRVCAPRTARPKCRHRSQRERTMREHSMRPIIAIFAIAIFAAAVALAASAARAEDYAAEVNVFIGTTNGGNTYPGATLPFGMVAFSPEETPLPGKRYPIAAPGGYEWRAIGIKGFSLTHLSGTGCTGASGDIPIMPVTIPVEMSPSADVAFNMYSSLFSHADEEASPGWYKVKLNNGATAELTATLRTAHARFTFPVDKPANLLIRTSDSEIGSSDARVRVDPAR